MKTSHINLMAACVLLALSGGVFAVEQPDGEATPSEEQLKQQRQAQFDASVEALRQTPRQDPRMSPVDEKGNDALLPESRLIR